MSSLSQTDWTFEGFELPSTLILKRLKTEEIHKIVLTPHQSQDGSWSVVKSWGTDLDKHEILTTKNDESWVLIMKPTGIVFGKLHLPAETEGLAIRKLVSHFQECKEKSSSVRIARLKLV